MKEAGTAMQFWRAFLSNISMQHQYFLQGRQEIARENLFIMQIAGAVGAVVCGIFFVIAPIVIPSWSVTKEYICVLPILALCFLFAFWYERRCPDPEPLVVEIACALFYILLLADFIALSVFPYPNTPQIFISLCFMFMPALLTQRPSVLVVIMLVAEVVFIVLAIKYKTTFSVENDIFNTIAALAFSGIILFITIRLRARNFFARLTLERLSRTDALTELMNKKAFEEYCAACLSSADARRGHVLLVLDLDDFKQINDNYGHPFGDALLTEVGHTMLHVFRQSDLAGRVGGDEFAVLMRDVTDAELVKKKCNDLRTRLAEIELDGTRLNVKCSIGAAISDRGRSSYAEMFRCADNELYDVKRGNKDGVSICRLG